MSTATPTTASGPLTEAVRELRSGAGQGLDDVIASGKVLGDVQYNLFAALVDRLCAPETPAGPAPTEAKPEVASPPVSDEEQKREESEQVVRQFFEEGGEQPAVEAVAETDEVQQLREELEQLRVAQTASEPTEPGEDDPIPAAERTAVSAVLADRMELPPPSLRTRDRIKNWDNITRCDIRHQLLSDQLFKRVRQAAGMAVGERFSAEEMGAIRASARRVVDTGLESEIWNDEAAQEHFREELERLVSEYQQSHPRSSEPAESTAGEETTDTTAAEAEALAEQTMRQAVKTAVVLELFDREDLPEDTDERANLLAGINDGLVDYLMANPAVTTGGPEGIVERTRPVVASLIEQNLEAVARHWTGRRFDLASKAKRETINDFAQRFVAQGKISDDAVAHAVEEATTEGQLERIRKTKPEEEIGGDNAD